MKQGKEGILLVVALELFGLVVAAFVALPRAVIKAIRLADGRLVQGMLSRSLALAHRGSLCAAGRSRFDAAGGDWLYSKWRRCGRVDALGRRGSHG